MSRKRRAQQPPQQAAENAPPPRQIRRPEADHAIISEPALLRSLWAETLHFCPWMIGFAVFAALLRFHQLTESNLWMDEIVMLEESGSRRYRLIAEQAHWMHLRPVEWLLGTFGQSPFVLRLWSALMGTLAVPVFALWGRFTFGMMGGLALGLLTATAPFLVLYAQDANYYGGMTLHTALLFLSAALVLRGGAWSGLAVMLAVGVVGYYNHPIFILPWGIVAGTTLLLTAALPDLRGRLIAVHPKNWLARPLLPLLAVGGVVGAVMLRGELSRIAGFVSFGGGRLTNVSATPGFVTGLLSHLLVNFVRPAGWERLLLFGPAIVIAGGVHLASRLPRDRFTSEWIGTVVLCAALPLISIPVLFAINVERAFYERYYIFLVPALLGLAAAIVPLVERGLSSPWRALIVLAPVLLLNLYGLGRLYITNTENYKAAIPVLKQEGNQHRIVVPHRNDLVQARYYVSKAGLPSKAPMLHSLFEHGARDRYAMPYHVALGGGDDPLLLSAWREIRAERFYGMINDSHDRLLRGVSRMGKDYDVYLYRWPAGTAPLFAGTTPGMSLLPVRYKAVTPGSWRLNDGSVVVLRAGEDVESTRLIGAQPVVDGPRMLTWADSIAWPLHPHSALEPDGRSDRLRLERDDTLEFAVYQPGSTAMELIIPAIGRPHGDPLLGRNGAPVPAGTVFSISVDGRHHSLHRLEATESQRLLRIPLDLAEGNHVLSIHVTSPRLDYTPFFPWSFGGLTWASRSGAEASIPWQVGLSPGWPTPPNPGTPGQNLAAPWISQGSGRAFVDPVMKGPDGQSVIVLTDLEAVSPKGSHTLLSPPIPVVPGTLLKCGYYLRVDGLEEVELNAALLLVGTNGQAIGGVRPAVGPNIRGTMPKSVWARRELLIPIPDGVAAVCIGLQVFPIQRPFHTADQSTIYLSTFFSSGTTFPPIIPASIK